MARLGRGSCFWHMLVNYVVKHNSDWKQITSKASWCWDSSGSAEQGQLGVGSHRWCQTLRGLLLSQVCVCAAVCVCVCLHVSLEGRLQHMQGDIWWGQCVCWLLIFTGQGQRETQQDSGSLYSMFNRGVTCWPVYTRTHTSLCFYIYENPFWTTVIPLTTYLYMHNLNLFQV